MFTELELRQLAWVQASLRCIRREVNSIKLTLSFRRDLDVLRRVEKFNPYHDQLGRFTTADGEGSGGSNRPVILAQARGGGSISARIGSYNFEVTPAQMMRLYQATNSAEMSLRQVRELDPNWKPVPSLFETAEGAIAAAEGEAAQAQARLSEILRDAIPNTSPSWGVNRLRKELNKRGYQFDEPTDAEGFMYRNAFGAEVRIMRRPRRQFRTDPLQKFYNDYYYRFRPGRGKGWGNHITIPDKNSGS